MITLEGLVTDGLRIDHFLAAPGEAWCLIGDNGSGLERLGQLLGGDEQPEQAVRFTLPPDLGLVSFRRQQQLYERELRLDDTDFLDRIDPGTPARAFLTKPENHPELLRLFAMEELLDRGYRQLSSGQSRKLLLLQQITRGVSGLVVENPYEGLDLASRQELDRIVARLHAEGLGIIVLVNNTGDIPPWCTHLALIKEGRMAIQGPAAEVEADIRRLFQARSPLFQVSVAELRQERQDHGAEHAGTNLITLRRGFARYHEVEVFHNLDLVINRGDHTLITGPNGCGKSTLVQIITGDHPLCYANELFLFGTKRGSGESIWDLKRQMGIVSADLHRNYRAAGSALAAVVSGLFDSIGLYVRPSRHQLQLGRKWLDRLGMLGKAEKPFRMLGYGEQRLLLLARALIKVPHLLVLDEPTHGLDEANRMALLDFLEKVAGEGWSTILYVSHRPDEYRPFFRQHVDFQPQAGDPVRCLRTV